MLETFPEKIKEEAQALGIENIKIANPEGCPNCYQGYKGRIGIFEALLPTPEIESILIAGGGLEDVRKEFESQGTLTLEQDCLLKVLKGKTSPKEMLRIIGVPVVEW